MFNGIQCCSMFVRARTTRKVRCAVTSLTSRQTLGVVAVLVDPLWAPAAREVVAAHCRLVPGVATRVVSFARDRLLKVQCRYKT